MNLEQLQQDDIALRLIDRAERLMARPDGHKGFRAFASGEIIGEFLLGLREFAAAYTVQGMPDEKAEDWHALVKQAALYVQRGFVRFYAPDGTLLPVNVIP